MSSIPLAFDEFCPGDGLVTWRHIRDYLNALSDAELDQPAQVAPHSDTSSPLQLYPVVVLGTVLELYHDEDGIDPTMSSFDLKHHPESVVLITEHSWDIPDEPD